MGTPEMRLIQREFMERDLLVLAQRFCAVESEPLRRSMISLLCELSEGEQVLPADHPCVPGDLLQLMEAFVNLKNDRIRSLIVEIIKEYSKADRN